VISLPQKTINRSRINNSKKLKEQRSVN